MNLAENGKTPRLPSDVSHQPVSQVSQSLIMKNRQWQAELDRALTIKSINKVIRKVHIGSVLAPKTAITLKQTRDGRWRNKSPVMEVF